MRVTGGGMRGRRLRVPAQGVRPTADRVREALFARLGDLSGARVLDLYAGSGALGIEALSRGAARAVFVERAAGALAVLRGNLASLGIEDRTEVFRGDVATVVRRLGRLERRFELVFLDPPYADAAQPERALRALVDSGILAAQATVVVETTRERRLPEVEGLAPLDERRYGDTVIHRLGIDPGLGIDMGRGATARPPGRAAGRTGEAMQERGAGAGAARNPRLALFAASFDPVTNGHLDLIHRARPLFPELVVAVARNLAKQGTFTVDERLEILEGVLGGEPGIRIASFEGLLVDYAREIGARVLVRGLRAVSDFEYEFEMALMNKRMYPEIETLFMMTSQQFFYVSSSRLKELVRFGANVGDFVPALVASKLKEKLGGLR
jgi:pantetheine-phosphate adenylyltransferase/16S rRNA (guanine(966)-N(2))-methyltransferase RsmD